MVSKEKEIEIYLKEVLDLEEIDVDLYRGITPHPVGRSYSLPRIFGGQTIGQSLVAAFRTVQPPLSINSLHSYFLRPGDPKLPIIYRVQRLRDGRTFSTRNVTAVQKGEAIFLMTASFHILEQGWEHQIEPPNVKGPEHILSDLEKLQKLKAERNLSGNKSIKNLELMYKYNPLNIDRRNCDDNSVAANFDGSKRLPISNIWLKVAGSLGDDVRLHQCALAYLSDSGLLGTSMLPHGTWFHQDVRKSASVDHAMWFHAPFRADEYLLYSTKSPQAANALGLNFGYFYQKGKLVVTTAQEGLIRPNKAKMRKIINKNNENKRKKINSKL